VSEATLSVDLSAAITGLAGEMRAERERKRQLAADVWFVHAPAIQIPALPAAGQAWGPNTGYCWAVQRITIAGFGATTDFITAYRGLSPTDVQPQNALFTFQETVAGGVATWHPGRTGLILMPDEGLAFGGTFTGTSPAVVNVDVIQLTVAKLPYLLL
jgi:hypothetical protein